MAGKKLNYYLMKIARVSGWLLFVLMITYIVTAFSLSGDFGFSRLIATEWAGAIHHRILKWPAIVVFLVHSLVTIYFAFRRWGWIKKRTRA